MSGHHRSSIAWLRPIALCLALAFSAGLAGAEPLKIRVVAANTTSGPNQSYDEGHGVRIVKSLQPDVVLIQEFNYTKGNLRELVDEMVGPGFHFYVENSGRIPNGVISRWPIKDAGSWEDAAMSDREFAWARIALPGGRNLFAVSVHLKAGKDGVEMRIDQAESLVKYVQQYVPKDDYLVLGGDFNTQVRGEHCVEILGEVVVNDGPYPTDQHGDGDTNANRNKPYDWVLAGPSLHKFSRPIELLGQKFPGGFVYDSRVQSPQIPPVQPGDSASQNMQHMAVARDFLLP